MKTPEEMAEEDADRIERQAILCVSLLAMNDGEYFAAKKAYKAGYQAARDQIADTDKVMNSLNNSNGWISVKERLPDNALEVIAISNGKSTAFLHKLAYCRWIIDETITHWMPLPKLPEE